MHDLPYYTAECDASVMRSQHPQHQAKALQRNLQACQDEINLVHLQPLIDLLQGPTPQLQHPTVDNPDESTGSSQKASHCQQAPKTATPKRRHATKSYP